MSRREETQARILGAATDEFAARGIAGARVDRIAERSGMSKPMIYAYFGGKAALFDAVFDAHVGANSERVPFTADDLAGYAVRLYDDYLADTSLMRLLMWKRLERTAAAYLYPGLEEIDAQHIRDIAEQQRLGRIRDDLDPGDVWALLISTAGTWAQNSITSVAAAADAAADHERRRAALAAYVSAALAPSAERRAD